MWRVAIQAITRLHRLMLHLARRQRIIMARQAQGIAFFKQQIFIRRFVRRMAAQAFAIIHRLMLDFAARQKIYVTTEAQLPDGHLGFRRHHVATVTRRTFVFRVRPMNDIFRRQRQLPPGGSRGRGLIRAGQNLRHRMIGPGRCGRHPIKEKSQPLMLRRRSATRQQQHPAGHRREQPKNLPVELHGLDGFPIRLGQINCRCRLLLLPVTIDIDLVRPQLVDDKH